MWCALVNVGVVRLSQPVYCVMSPPRSQVPQPHVNSKPRPPLSDGSSTSSTLPQLIPRHRGVRKVKSSPI